LEVWQLSNYKTEHLIGNAHFFNRFRILPHDFLSFDAGSFISLEHVLTHAESFGHRGSYTMITDDSLLYRWQQTAYHKCLAPSGNL
jgi:hypothetical protein